MADVNVTFSADDSELRRAIDGIKGNFTQLETPAVGMGQKITAAFGKIGLDPAKAFPTMGAKEQNALAQYGASLEKVKTATNEVSEASGRAGINIGAMLERMAVRLVIFEAIRLAIKGLVDAFKEAAARETLEVRFENLSRSTKTAESDLQQFKAVATGLGIPFKDLVSGDLELQKMGESAQQAAYDVQVLGKYALTSGENIGTLAKALHDVSLTRGSIEEIKDLISAMGAAGDPLMKQADALEKQAIALPRITEFEEHLATIQNQRQERQRRESDAMVDFGEKLGLVEEAFKRLRSGDRGPIFGVVRGGVDVSRQESIIRQRLEAGERQMALEEGLTQAQVRQLENAGLITAKDLMGAEQRAYEERRRAVQEAREEARFQRRWKQEQALIQLQQDTAKAIEDQVGLETQLAAQQQTAAAAMERASEAVSQILGDDPKITAAVHAWAGFALDFANALAGAVKEMEDLVNFINKLLDLIPKTKLPAYGTPERAAERAAEPRPVHHVPGYLGREEPPKTAADQARAAKAAEDNAKNTKMLLELHQRVFENGG